MVELGEASSAQVLVCAEELIDESVPGVLTLTQIAEHVKKVKGNETRNVRHCLWEHVRRGRLVELRVDRQWRVTWPQAEGLGVTNIRLVPELHVVSDQPKREAMLLVLTTDPSARARRTSPSRMTFVTSRKQATLFLRSVLIERGSDAPQLSDARG